MDLDSIPSTDSSFAANDASSLDWTRVPFRYRRRKVFESRFSTGEPVEPSQISGSPPLSRGADDETAGSTNVTMESQDERFGDTTGRRVTFSERRRRKQVGSANSPPQAHAHASGANGEAHSATNGKHEQHTSLNANGAQEASHKIFSSSTAAQASSDAPALALGPNMVKRSPDAPMRVARAALKAKQRDARDEKVGALNLAPPPSSDLPPAPLAPSNIATATLNSNDVEKQVMEKLAALEKQIKSHTENRTFSEDALGMIREHLQQLQSLLASQKEMGIDKAMQLNRGVGEVMRMIRLHMVTDMTQTTQYTFESLEDVRSMLIAQILADEEQVQWELEKMDAEMGHIAQPVGLWQKMAQMMSPMAGMALPGVSLPLGGIDVLGGSSVTPAFIPNPLSPQSLNMTSISPTNTNPFSNMANTAVMGLEMAPTAAQPQVPVLVTPQEKHAPANANSSPPSSQLATTPTTTTKEHGNHVSEITATRPPEPMNVAENALNQLSEAVGKETVEKEVLEPKASEMQVVEPVAVAVDVTPSDAAIPTPAPDSNQSNKDSARMDVDEAKNDQVESVAPAVARLPGIHGDASDVMEVVEVVEAEAKQDSHGQEAEAKIETPLETAVPPQPAHLSTDWTFTQPEATIEPASTPMEATVADSDVLHTDAAPEPTSATAPIQELPLPSTEQEVAPVSEASEEPVHGGADNEAIASDLPPAAIADSNVENVSDPAQNPTSDSSAVTVDPTPSVAPPASEPAEMDFFPPSDSPIDP